MRLNKKFDMDSVGEYHMEKELYYFLNCEATDCVDTDYVDCDYADADKNIPMEVELCEFYFQTISELVGRDERRSGAKNVRRFLNVLQSLTDPWCQFENNFKEEQEQLKDTLYYRIEYIYRNSTCISSAVAHHFGNFLNQNRNIRNELLKKRELRICSVGGGSPSDVVALVKVLESNVDAKEELDIHVSIIDGNKKWQMTCLVVLGCLERFRNAVRKIDFVHADLFHPFSDEVKRAIRNADIVSMAKVFSELERCKNPVKIKAKNLFQKVHKLVQPGSLVFCLDAPLSDVMFACGGSFGMVPRHCLLYEVVCDLYTLDKSVVERHFLLYSYMFPGHVCNTAFLLFCRVWLKSPTNSPEALHLEPINDKFIKIQEELKEVNKQCEELKKKFQLFCEYEKFSFKEWRDSTYRELGRMGRSKKETCKMLSAAKHDLNRKLKSRKEMMNSFCNERVNSPQQARKELEDVRKSFVASKTDAEEAKLRVHQQSIRKLMKSFELKDTAL